ncbi:MAG: GAF and ANTAR domain-containing protein [Solirubrobacteraceae bacterium]
MASADGDAPSVIDRVCMAAVALLSLRGAGISLMANGVLRGSAGVSEPGVAAIQELQLMLGEGPCVDAWAANQPVLEPDLADPEEVRWPTFAQAAGEAGIRAVFAFPLHLGASRMGVLVLYRDRPNALSAEELAQGLVLSDVAGQVVLAVQAGAPADRVHELLAGEPPHWAEVHQATGVVSAQLGVSMDEAFVRLRAHSFAAERSLQTVARDVVARRVRLEQSG